MVALRVEQKLTKNQLDRLLTVLKCKVELLLQTKVLIARSECDQLFNLIHVSLRLVVLN